MRQVAIINQKGGVGKTTTTANLGAALARAGSRVLLVDLDPQGHLSLHFGAELRDGQNSVYDVLTAATPVGETTLQVGTNLTLVPADIDLAGAEAELVSVTGREVLLREALAAAEGQYDYVLIDCPPSLGVLTVNALVACNEVLIPLQAQFFALQGLSKLLDTVMLVRQRINPGLEVTGVVLCMHEPYTRLASEVVDDLRGFLSGARDSASPWSRARVFETFIRRNIRLAEASSFGQTVFDYSPKSNGAIDYARLAVEIFGDAARVQDRSGQVSNNGAARPEGQAEPPNVARAVDSEADAREPEPAEDDRNGSEGQPSERAVSFAVPSIPRMNGTS